uniref:Uncharacterized protein n=1 Tax=Meloidogyne incognita TaxID=6306 RepID=A0A914M9S9_MELIC
MNGGSDNTNAELQCLLMLCYNRLPSRSRSDWLLCRPHEETLEDGGSPTTLPSNSARCATYRLYQ